MQSVASVLGTKSMTGKIAEGTARGRAKNTGGVLINTFKIRSIPFIKTSGFFALWAWEAPVCQGLHLCILLSFFGADDYQFFRGVDFDPAFQLEAQFFQPFAAQGEFRDDSGAAAVETVFGLDFEAPCPGPFGGSVFGFLLHVL